jgi:hypothetical protein
VMPGLLGRKSYLGDLPTGVRAAVLVVIAARCRSAQGGKPPFVTSVRGVMLEVPATEVP